MSACLAVMLAVANVSMCHFDDLASEVTASCQLHVCIAIAC